jgi:hypothetical protein
MVFQFVSYLVNMDKCRRYQHDLTRSGKSYGYDCLIHWHTIVPHSLGLHIEQRKLKLNGLKPRFLPIMLVSTHSQEGLRHFGSNNLAVGGSLLDLEDSLFIKLLIIHFDGVLGVGDIVVEAILNPHKGLAFSNCTDYLP